MTNINSLVDYDIVKYCPDCGDKLTMLNAVDVLIKQWICVNNHQYYSPMSKIFTHQTGVEFKQLQCNGTNVLSISREWLSNIFYREHIGHQVAAILRTLWSFVINKNCKIPKDNFYVNFCVICRNPLSIKKERIPVDIYESTYICINQHEFHHRDGLRFMTEVTEFELCPDMSLNRAIELAEKYTTDKWLSDYVPEQVKSVLLQLIQKIKK